MSQRQRTKDARANDKNAADIRLKTRSIMVGVYSFSADDRPLHKFHTTEPIADMTRTPAPLKSHCLLADISATQDEKLSQTSKFIEYPANRRHLGLCL
jgi:hypothetical protein